ncbi:hypothetical protein KP509_38G022700 [Ceratopteris richardii]|nr:hypothetical protein KP509_38G022700 [Ceratopteris richardii]
MERVATLEKWVQSVQLSQQALDERSTRRIRSLERQLCNSAASSSSTVFARSKTFPSSGGGVADVSSTSCSQQVRTPRLAYSSSFKKPEVPCVFQMPLHYPKYCRADYESMPEWKLDSLLEEYGLPVSGDLADKKKYAMGVFLWN